MVINGNDCGTNIKSNWIYLGFDKKTSELVYVGTTMQKPSDRFRWHRHNGKDLIFKVYRDFNTYHNSVDLMLDEEVKLIEKYSPKLNKKTKRHNDNRKLNKKDLAKRKGEKCWCQSCLKRRVNSGYSHCYFCSKR